MTIDATMLNMLNPKNIPRTPYHSPTQTSEEAHSFFLPLATCPTTTQNSSPLTLPVLNLKTSILFPMSDPPIRPPLHPLPSFSTTHINSRNNLFNPQRRTKHTQLSKTRMFRIRYSKTFTPISRPSLWRQIFDGICRFPGRGVEYI
jgi:hypothetical protein